MMNDAREARYDRVRHALVLDLHSGVTMVIPIAHIPSLEHVMPDDLAAITNLGNGDTLWWEGPDISLSTSGIVRDATGHREQSRRGGQAKSDAKTLAVRENGKKGGRPRKTTLSPTG